MNLVIGLGKVFWEYYYPNINKNNYKFYDMYTSDLPDSVKYIDNFNEILDSEYKCIYLLTPPNTRTEIINALCSNTQSFYIEKPIFPSLQEYKQINLLDKDVHILGGHSRRFFNNYKNLKNILIETKKTSKISSISVSEGSIYKWNPKKIESITNDELSHLVDSIIYILNFTDKVIDYEVTKVKGDNISNISIECIVENIHIDINFSRNSDLLNQIKINFEDNTSYLLNSKLNGSLQIFSNNNLINLDSLQNKQSSISVFNQIINHVDSETYIEDQYYKLNKFDNTLMLLDEIKEKL